MIGVDLHGPYKTCCLLYLLGKSAGLESVTRSQFVYDDDKRVDDRKCLPVFMLPA